MLPLECGLQDSQFAFGFHSACDTCCACSRSLLIALVLFPFMAIAKLTPARGVECTMSSVNSVTSEREGFGLFIVLLVVWDPILLGFQIFHFQVRKLSYKCYKLLNKITVTVINSVSNQYLVFTCR